MKFIYVVIIFYSIPFYAQQSGYKIYVDSLNGFSMEIPKQYFVSTSRDGYLNDVKEYGSKKFNYSAQSKREFIDSYFPGYRHRIVIEEDDTLLAIQKLLCVNEYHIRASLVTTYNIIDSLIQFSNNNDVKVIEFHRTNVAEHPDDDETGIEGPVYSDKWGPLYFVELFAAENTMILWFDFWSYSTDYDYNICSNIISSIKLIEQ